MAKPKRRPFMTQVKEAWLDGCPCCACLWQELSEQYGGNYSVEFADMCRLMDKSKAEHENIGFWCGGLDTCTLRRQLAGPGWVMAAAIRGKLLMPQSESGRVYPPTGHPN